MHQAVVPPAEVCTDYETLCALAERLGFLDAFSEGRDGDEWVRHFYESTRENLRGRGRRAAGLRGVLGRRARSRCRRRRASASSTSPRCAPIPAAAPLPTPSGRIELASATIAGFGYDDCPGHPAWMEPAEWLGSRARGALPAAPDLEPAVHAAALAVRQRRLQPGLQGRGPRADPAASRMTRAARGIADGDVVRVFNDRGSCLAGAVLDRRACAARSCSSRPAPGGIPSRPATPRRSTATATRTCSRSTRAPRGSRRARARRRRSSSSSASTGRCPPVGPSRRPS